MKATAPDQNTDGDTVLDKSTPSHSDHAARQLPRHQDQHRTIAEHLYVQGAPTLARNATVSTGQPHRAPAIPSSVPKAPDDNPENHPENLLTHGHPSVPATGAAVEPVAAEPGAAPC